MRDVEFLCLAVSRRDGGNCIAGIDLSSGKWIRPINTRSNGPFGDHEIFVSEGGSQQPRIMALLDVLHLQLGSYVGENAQPENWEINPPSYESPYWVLRKFTRKEDYDKLRSYLDRSELLLHSISDSIQQQEVRAHKLTHSLSLIRPEQLYWKIAENPMFPSRLKVRADFTFDKNLYSLVVTDPIWEAKCRTFGKGRYPHALIAGEENTQVLLTISLAALPIHERHYKLVAGVIVLPH